MPPLNWCRNGKTAQPTEPAAVYKVSLKNLASQGQLYQFYLQNLAFLIMMVDKLTLSQYLEISFDEYTSLQELPTLVQLKLMLLSVDYRDKLIPLGYLSLRLRSCRVGSLIY